MASANPFEAPLLAERYARGRPYHHRRTVERCLAFSQHTPGGLALEVACGTGLSTRALAELGFRVVGVDLTPSMVGVARQQEGLPFAVAAAECLPVRDRSVAMITVGSGVHWFDATRFYAEAVRLLAPSGILIVYEHAGVGLPDDERFSAWITEVYLARFPSRPTPGRWLASAEPPEGLAKVASESWVDIIEFSREELVAYLLTQGNVSSPIDAHEVVFEDVRQWLVDESGPFFVDSPKRSFSVFVMAETFVADGQRV